MAEEKNENVAYCVKCKESKEMANPQEDEIEGKSGKRRVMRGHCPDCDTKMMGFLKSKKD